MKMILSLIILASLNNVQASNLSQFFTTNANTTSGRVVFDRDSTWTVPAGVTKINVEIIGAGGGAAVYGGGGGGGGSCIKNGATLLASADGGRGANTGELQAQPGGVTRTSLSVTGGATLNIYLGGGGGGGGYSTNYSGGGGGYGFCGSSGAGGTGSVAGGAGAVDKGGGGGGGSLSVGAAAGSSTGGTGGTGGNGGTALVGGTPVSYAGGGGASGGVGGAGGYTDGSTVQFMATSGKFGANIHSATALYGSFACTNSFSVFPGSPGVRRPCYQDYGSLGGAGGGVIISW